MADNTHTFPKTISESVYNHLKEDIIDNKFKANEKITGLQIAKLFGVSISPVRDALFRLEAEGYINIDSSRRMTINSSSYDELDDIFEVLAHIDALAMRMIVISNNKQCLLSIEKLIPSLDKYCNLNNIEKYIDFNYQFHRNIWKCIPNDFLQSTLNRILDQVLRYKYSRIKAFKKPDALKNSLNDHKKIVELLKSKKEGELITVITNHWGTAASKTLRSVL